MRLSPGFDQGGELGKVAFGQVGQGSLQVRPDWFHRVQLVRIWREPVDRQPVPRCDQAGHRVADVHIEVVPHHDEGAGELLVGGVQQCGAVRFGDLPCAGRRSACGRAGRRPPGAATRWLRRPRPGTHSQGFSAGEEDGRRAGQEGTQGMPPSGGHGGALGRSGGHGSRLSAVPQPAAHHVDQSDAEED